MSRISSASSASGVRVAAQPLSNVYTVLTIIAFLALVLALVMLWVTLDKRYGSAWPISDEAKKAEEAPKTQKQEQDIRSAKLADQEKVMAGWVVETAKAPEAAKPAEATKAPEGAGGGVALPPAP